MSVDMFDVINVFSRAFGVGQIDALFHHGLGAPHGYVLGMLGGDSPFRRHFNDLSSGVRRYSYQIDSIFS
jgi:hypothetical protein